jgi:hypothetical protein
MLLDMDIPKRYWGIYVGIGLLLVMTFDMWRED